MSKFLQKEIICTAFAPILGTTDLQFGRAAAMGWVSFTTLGGHSYSLHIQCAFRVRRGAEILIGNLDMFYPTPAMAEDPTFSWEAYDWDVQGANAYDQWARRIKGESIPFQVGSPTVSDCGDLTLPLGEGLFLELFLNQTVEEGWRFFCLLPDAPHLVVTGLGLLGSDTGEVREDDKR